MSMGNRCNHGRKFQMVTKRNYNESAFNGYHQTYSDYSTIRCVKCGAHYRAKGKFVSRLPDAPDGWHKMNEKQLCEALGIKADK